MVAINGAPLAQRDWRDTVVVPRNGSVTFRARFLDFTGRFVHHYHMMMNHEAPRGLSTDGFRLC